MQAGGGSGWTSNSTLMGSTFTTHAAEHLNYLATLRLRAGYTLYDRWLIFATGGLAVGGVKVSSDVVMDLADEFLGLVVPTRPARATSLKAAWDMP